MNPPAVFLSLGEGVVGVWNKAAALSAPTAL
jgi:hypothetical protein